MKKVQWRDGAVPLISVENSSFPGLLFPKLVIPKWTFVKVHLQFRILSLRLDQLNVICYQSRWIVFFSVWRWLQKWKTAKNVYRFRVRIIVLVWRGRESGRLLQGLGHLNNGNNFVSLQRSDNGIILTINGCSIRIVKEILDQTEDAVEDCSVDKERGSCCENFHSISFWIQQRIAKLLNKLKEDVNADVK